MNILTIQLGHNATVAYTENNELKYVLQEEKFDNIKNSSNFPAQSIAFLDKNFDLSKLDSIVMSSLGLHAHTLDRNEEKGERHEKKGRYGILLFLYEGLLFYGTKYFPKLFYTIYDRKLITDQKKNLPKLRQRIQESISTDISSVPIEFVEHHVCHALSPVYFYGLHKKDEPTLIFTLDGSGDKYSATVRIWRNGKLETLATTRWFYSLGYIWSSITMGMGMKPLEHEYKIMGLAAYTEEKYYKDVYDTIFKDLIWIDGLNWKSKIPTNRAYRYFRDKFYGIRFDNIAGALQHMTEELVLEWIQNAIKKTGIRNIATSGGVFMNVKLNKRIQEADFIDHVYFMPSCGDESNVIGGTFQALISKSGKDIPAINTMYSGIINSDEQVRSFVKQFDAGKYDIQDIDPKQSSNVIADLLAEFKIVGVVRGAGEWGARSLCNRAILANASDLKSFHTVNDMIKMRDFWMPFAPVILEEGAEKYIKDWGKLKPKSNESHQYMISAVDSTPLAQEHLRAAIHQKDKTLRPQLINETNNPWMMSVLKNFEKKTGISGMMNTSLNIHGYPLVGTLEQALFTLENSGLQYMLLGDTLIKKK